MTEKKKKRSLADELRGYGESLAYGLQNGAREVGQLSRMLEAKMHPVVREGAQMAIETMPGAGTMESLRLGSEAGRLWREGNYADSLDTYADALDAPFQDVFWFVPGGGIIPKVMK